MATFDHGTYTLPETNSHFAPENGSSEKETSIPKIRFQVRAVSFREGSLLYPSIGLDLYSFSLDSTTTFRLVVGLAQVDLMSTLLNLESQ